MRENKKAGRSWMALRGLVALIVATGVVVRAEEPAASQEPSAAAASVEKGTEARVEQGALRRPRLAGGLRAHIDPETGVLMVPPLKARRELQLSPQLLDALSTSHDGLRAVKMPNGLTYVDLQGRFQSATMVTLGEDGAIEVHHAVPAASEAAEAGDAEKAASTPEDQP